MSKLLALPTYRNLHEYIYKGYDGTQNDSMNPYPLPVSCQKLMARQFQFCFLLYGIRVPMDVNKEVYKILQKPI